MKKGSSPITSTLIHTSGISELNCYKTKLNVSGSWWDSGWVMVVCRQTQKQKDSKMEMETVLLATMSIHVYMSSLMKLMFNLAKFLLLSLTLKKLLYIGMSQSKARITLTYPPSFLNSVYFSFSVRNQESIQSSLTESAASYNV